MSRSRPAARARRRGATLVEFALIVPVLLTLLLGIMEFGWRVKSQLTMANAIREGARAASLGKSTTDIRTRVRNSMSPIVVTDSQIQLNYSATSGADNYPFTMGNTGTKNNVPAGQLIRVRASVPHAPLTGFFPFLNNRNITVFVTMRREYN